MTYVETSMKNYGFVVTSEAIFKYYLAFLENTEN